MPNPLNRSNLSEQISEIIKNKIENGDYADGEKLPSENELTKIYGVSRLTIRSAIQRLNALGLVETKAGYGTYVKKFDLKTYLKSVSSKIMQPDMLENVADFRKLIELESIKLTIKLATDEELIVLKKISEKYCELANKFIKGKSMISEENLDKLVECDYSFHLAICELSKNSLYKTAYLTVQEPIKLFLKSIIKSRIETSIKFDLTTELHDVFSGHYAIYEAIKERDIEKAEKLFKNIINHEILIP
ncbi:FadR/GntR family transcriptional regulator [Streptococcus pacificus]|uniref:FadR family transcriptional regulator n=1 Tax=Streptococcus pacificus TaxID=2740577 RepID=A0ABS0ZJM8_9STRE|nr:FadR/GntR family transcriptional regulator [Streptococcus pacificus]MBJ8326210.1 FadR family transcriptional regulator [Streptococcus pacificus]